MRRMTVIERILHHKVEHNSLLFIEDCHKRLIGEDKH